MLLLLIFGTELVCGIAVLADSRLSTPVQVMCYALSASVLVGIARAWELRRGKGHRPQGLALRADRPCAGPGRQARLTRLDDRA